MTLPKGHLTHLPGISRTWTFPDGTTCVHPYRTGEPSGYVSWQEWAKTMNKTHTPTECPTPGCPIYVLMPKMGRAHQRTEVTVR